MTRILITNDEGLGDEILYGAFLGDFLRTHMLDDVWWEGHYLLQPILRRTYLEGEFFLRRKIDPATADVIMPACELPRKKTHGYIPADLNDFAERGRLRVRHDMRRRLIGLSWFSQNHTLGAAKSARLEVFAPLLADSAVVNLQYGDTTAERRLADMPLFTNPAVDQLMELHSFMNQVAACDVVVTTSNTTLHVAGALGVRTFLLLPDTEGPWYWNDMPYNGVTVCRGEGEQWATQALAQALERLG